MYVVIETLKKKEQAVKRLKAKTSCTHALKNDQKTLYAYNAIKTTRIVERKKIYRPRELKTKRFFYRYIDL